MLLCILLIKNCTFAGISSVDDIVGTQNGYVSVSDEISDYLKNNIPDPGSASSKQRELVNKFFDDCSSLNKRLKEALKNPFLDPSVYENEWNSLRERFERNYANDSGVNADSDDNNRKTKKKKTTGTHMNGGAKIWKEGDSIPQNNNSGPIGGINFGESKLNDIDAKIVQGVLAQNGDKLYYALPDGSYAISSWVNIDLDGDGLYEYYYFGNDGFLVVNTTTPDGHVVNEIGQLIDNGIVQKFNNGAGINIQQIEGVVKSDTIVKDLGYGVILNGKREIDTEYGHVELIDMKLESTKIGKYKITLIAKGSNPYKLLDNLPFIKFYVVGYDSSGFLTDRCPHIIKDVNNNYNTFDFISNTAVKVEIMPWN